MTSNSKQILQICHDYKPPFLYLSGQYAKLFKDTGYQITTVYLKGAPDELVVQQSYADEVMFLNLSSKQIRGLKLRAIYHILKLHQRKQFRFAITHRYQALYIATHVPRLPVIGVHHDFIEYRRWSHRVWANYHKQRLCLLGVSNAVRNELRRCLPKFPQQQIQTLYNSVDPEQMRAALLARETARSALGLSDHFWFVNVGRLHPNKDQATLIRGFAKIANEIPQARLAIIGTGPSTEELQALAQQENIADRVLFMGQVKDSYQYLRAFDSFVLSSTSEPFGMVLLEAMLAGLPILASNRHGIPEVVGDSGWLFTPEDAAELALGMKTIYHLDESTRIQYQQKMYQRVLDHFSTDAMRKQFWALPFVPSYSAASL
jgi:glycosyltransferase involved in cell wall biosynthesis